MHFDQAILLEIDRLDWAFMQTSWQWKDLLVKVTIVAVELT
jgi:hypothetical protein